MNPSTHPEGFALERKNDEPMMDWKYPFGENSEIFSANSPKMLKNAKWLVRNARKERNSPYLLGLLLRKSIFSEREIFKMEKKETRNFLKNFEKSLPTF